MNETPQKINELLDSFRRGRPIVPPLICVLKGFSRNDTQVIPCIYILRQSPLLLSVWNWFSLGVPTVLDEAVYNLGGIATLTCGLV